MKKKNSMRINILKKGDKVLSVSSNFVAVSRKNGEVDLIPFAYDQEGSIRIAEDKIITIGYGDNTVEVVRDGVKFETF